MLEKQWVKKVEANMLERIADLGICFYLEQYFEVPAATYDPTTGKAEIGIPEDGLTELTSEQYQEFVNAVNQSETE